MFSCRLSELVRYGKSESKFSLRVQEESKNLCLNVSITKKDGISVKLEHNARDVKEMLELIEKCLGEKEIHYLPASRSGILQAYRVITQAIIQTAPLAPIRGFEIRVSGIIADFLGKLIMLGKSEKLTQMHERNIVRKELMNYFEEKILEGKLESVKSTEIEIPDIMYLLSVNHGIPITRTSSMVSELAPLVLFIKYGIVEKGDIVIIEEPEAHLHPEVQAELAKILTKLINELNLQIIITTHSEILLSKLSNLISLNILSDEELLKRNYSRSETLSPQKVSVYLFKKVDEDIVIEQINVTEDGIPDHVFRKVIEELYEETMDTYYSIQKFKQKL